jgi:transcriptional regulator with XRE-family HTH domain
MGGGLPMYGNTSKVSEPETRTLRLAGGDWLRSLREARGLTQRQVADQLGFPLYTFISQLENGHGRVPPDRYRDWANVLGIEPKLFVQNILKYYDPKTYEILFDKVPDTNDLPKFSYDDEIVLIVA